MKDHAERSGRLQLMEYMSTGQSWQEAIAQSKLNVSRSTAYRLAQLGRSGKAELALSDGRQGHAYKLTKPVQEWLVERCRKDPEVPSSQIQADLLKLFAVKVSIGHINQMRKYYGITRSGRAGKKKGMQ